MIAAGTFGYIRPDELWTLAGGVAIGTGAVDSDHLAAWLVDGKSRRPIRMTGTALGATITNPAGEIGAVVVGNSNVSVSTTLSAGLTGTVPAGALRLNGIRRNGFLLISPAAAGVTAFTIAITGNVANVAIGEVMAGKLRTCRAPRPNDMRIEEDDFPNGDPDQRLSSVPPHDQAQYARRMSGWGVYTTAEKDEFLEWSEAQRGSSRPSAFFPGFHANDAWIGRLVLGKRSPIGTLLWRVDWGFTEYPRDRW